MRDTRSTPPESPAAGERRNPAAQRERELNRKTVAPLGSPFEAKVVGVSFVEGYPANLYQLDDIWQGKHPDEPLSVVLIRNPANAYDSNAIEVHVPALGEQGFLGHITAPLAARMAPEMDAGVVWGAEVISVLIDPDHLEHPGISIKCYRVLDELIQEAQRLGLE